MALDSRAHSTETERTGLSAQVVDFGEGLFHGAVENPVNGAVQLMNHVSGAHLPEMHLTNENDLNTVGGKIGEFAGGAADMVGLTLATGGLGGAGIVGSGLKMAALGAAYSGIFQPTDANSKNFFGDRLANAAVAGTTFGAMGLAAGAIDSFMPMAVPAGRTFLQSMEAGGLAGAVGGLAGAEANAVFKKGDVVPTFADVVSSTAGGALFGAAAGAAGFALNRAETFGNDNAVKLKVWSDADGQPARIEGRYIPTGMSQNTSAFRTADGKWTVSDNYRDFTTDAYPIYDSASKTTAGDLQLSDSKTGLVTTIGKDGKYAYTEGNK